MNVSNLFNLVPFYHTKILAGERGLGRKVLNATFFDAPDGYKWCKKGDFIVTTGYPFTRAEKWQKGLLSLITKLVEKNCSGLAIKLGRYVPELPIEVINYADENNFPIINLPNNLSWTDVIVPIITSINKHQEYELEMTHNIYEKFHNHLKAKGSLEELANLLNTIIDYPVTIYIRNYNKTIDTHEKRFLDHEIEFMISNLNSNQGSTIQKIHFKEDKFTVKWIYSSGNITGGVFLWGLDTNLQAWEKAALEQTAVVTALEIEKNRTVAKTFQHFRNDFLAVLLKGDQNIKKEVIYRRAKELNWDLEDSYKVVLLDCNLEDISDKITGPAWQKKVTLLDTLESELRWFLPETHIGLDSNNRIVFLIPKTEDDRELLEKFKRLTEKVNIASFSGGIGRLKDIDKLYYSYQEAIIAHKVAKADQFRYVNAKKQNQLHIRNYNDLDVERILYSDNPKEESINIVKEYLQQIIDYDKERDSELLNTLKVFIDSNANYHDTAQSLFIHKNTVRYRINIIKSLTKLDPSKMKDLLLIQMAIKALETFGKLEMHN